MGCFMGEEGRRTHFLIQSSADTLYACSYTAQYIMPPSYSLACENRQLVTSRVWRFGFETSWFQNFTICLIASDSVTKKFGMVRMNRMLRIHRSPRISSLATCFPQGIPSHLITVVLDHPVWTWTCKFLWIQQIQNIHNKKDAFSSLYLDKFRICGISHAIMTIEESSWFISYAYML